MNMKWNFDDIMGCKKESVENTKFAINIETRERF